MDGIWYTVVCTIERIYRDIRLASIWTGTCEVMSMIVAHEWYGEVAKSKADAEDAFVEDEKIYE